MHKGKPTLDGEEASLKGLQPLFKWPGGKRRILSTLAGLIPLTFNRYFEPFLGGGALYFHLHPGRARLSDRNSELINCYIQVRDNVEAVIQKLHRWPNSEATYYAVRHHSPKDLTDAAARFLYLTSLSFNGIYRVNLRGEFNVPYGYKTHLIPCDSSRLRLYSQAMADAKLSCKDFKIALSSAKAGDVVYLDPPYTVAHGNNGFLKYNERIFSWPDQERLCHVATRLADRGAKVIVSNADHPSVLALYKEFSSIAVPRASVIAADSTARRAITERLFFN
jgi:DNA adenine methylase